LGSKKVFPEKVKHILRNINNSVYFVIKIHHFKRMKRRKMIGQMAILTVGLPFVPGFLRASHNNLLKFIPDNTLDAVIDVIIPEGKTPGAISLGVSDYVKIMLLDGVSKEQILH
jgi:hypothetical protein